MSIELIAEATICTAYVCAIEYGDYSSFELCDDTEAEIKLVEDFVNQYPYASYDWSDDEPYFTRDDISGLMADCVDVQVWGAK